VGVALRDQAYEIAYVPFLDLMNALGAPIRNNVPPQETGYAAVGPDLRDVFTNECLHQVIDPIDDQAAARLLFSSAGSRPSSRAAKIFCAWALAIGRVTRP
jgi:hypothetical protein